jgi:hypothetical protein
MATCIIAPVSINVGSDDERLVGNGQVHMRHNALTTWISCGIDVRVSHIKRGTMSDNEGRSVRSEENRREETDMIAQKSNGDVL